MEERGRGEIDGRREKWNEKGGEEREMEGERGSWKERERERRKRKMEGERGRGRKAERGKEIWANLSRFLVVGCPKSRKEKR